MSNNDEKKIWTPGQPEAETPEVNSDGLSRRGFLRNTLGLAAAATVAPALSKSAFGPFVARGQNVGKEKLNVLFVATGGRADNHVKDLAERKENCIAYCDVDTNHMGKAKELFPKADSFTDWRNMFDRYLAKADAVIVTTPDHTHALPSLYAMLAGKAVYCEKPLTWSIEESRLMAQVAAQKKVATQMGNQGHAGEGIRTTIEWVRSGVLGEITEVHTWTNRPIWDSQGNVSIEEAPKPASLNWDAWLGPASMRPYHKKAHGFAWRGWFDYGCGAVGDMGCHTWDAVYWALNPDYPSSVELLNVEDVGKHTFARRTHFKWDFPAKGARPAFVSHWYSGGFKPAVPDEIKNDPDRPEDRRGLPDSGCLFIGTKGKMLVTGDYSDSPLLIPEKFRKETKRPEKTIPRSPGHMTEFVRAAKGEAAWDSPGSNFSGYAGPLTEVMLLGSIVEKIGEVGYKFECDPVKREIITPRVRAMRGREYRKGYELPKI